MNLSVLLLALSIVALVIALLQVVFTHETDKRRWRKVVFLGLALFCVNVTVEVGKRVVEQRREAAEKQREAEQREMNLQLISDVESLNKAATEAFEKLNETVQSLPASTALSLREEARRVHDQLGAVNQADISHAHDDATIARLRDLIQHTQASINNLDASIKDQQLKETTADEAHFPAEVPVRSTEMQSVPNRTTTQAETSGNSPSTLDHRLDSDNHASRSNTFANNAPASPPSVIGPTTHARDGMCGEADVLDILVGADLTTGFDVGVNSSNGKTHWLEKVDGFFKIAYPANEAWGTVFITVGSPKDRPRPLLDFSACRTLSIEMKSGPGAKRVEIGIKTNTQLDDGSESKKPVSLATEWKTYEMPLSAFSGTDLARLYVVTEFVFAGSDAQIIYFRNIKYLGREPR
jgi:hypothetical protein